MVDARWQAVADSWGLGDLGDALAHSVVPCVRMVGTRPVDTRVGASRLAGAPDLPRGTSVPHREGVPLSLALQVDLASLEPGWVPDLPRTGWLWLFLDTSRRDDGLFAHSLLHADVPATELRATVTSGLEWTARSPMFESSFALAWRPDLDDDDADRLLELPGGTTIGGCGPSWRPPGQLAAALHSMGLDAIDGYMHMDDARLEEEIERHRDARPEWAQAHARFLESIVKPQLANYRARRAEIESAAQRFRTLLVLDSVREVGWCWGDAGLLEVLIDGDDLRARRFDRTYLRLCSS